MSAILPPQRAQAAPRSRRPALEIRPWTPPADIQDESNYYKLFAAVVCQEMPAEGAAVLDVGAGANLRDEFLPIRQKAARLAGVDPGEEVLGNERLDVRLRGTLEEANLEAESFDLLFASYVAEHIERPEPFLREACRILKPGGKLVFFTPHGRHPFCLLSRGLELAGAKELIRRLIGQRPGGGYRVNDYPAYYRLNTPRAVARHGANAGFRAMRFHLTHSGWEWYFPWWLRFLPKSYDRLAQRVPALRLMLICVLEK